MGELYHQMTLMEWVKSKDRIRKMIRQAKASFVVIGYELRKIEESRAYEMDGYESLAEFAKEEFDFKPDMTSRLIAVNRAFSEGGYSDILVESAEGFSFSKLVEMKDLEPEDLELIRPQTPREAIRELKRFNASGEAFGMNPPEGTEEAAGQIGEKPEGNPERTARNAEQEAEKAEQEAEKPKPAEDSTEQAEEHPEVEEGDLKAAAVDGKEPVSPHAGWIKAFFEKYPETAKDLKETDFSTDRQEEMIDRMVPSGDRTFIHKTVFALLSTGGIRIKQLGKGNSEMSWEEFFDIAEQIIRNMAEKEEESGNERGSDTKGDGSGVPENTGKHHERDKSGVREGRNGLKSGKKRENTEAEPHSGPCSGGQTEGGEPGGETEDAEGIAPAQIEEAEPVKGTVETAEETERADKTESLKADATRLSGELAGMIGTGDYIRAKAVLLQLGAVINKLLESIQIAKEKEYDL